MSWLRWLLAGCLALAAAGAQDVVATAEAFPPEARVGEPVTYRVRARVLNEATREIEATPPSFRGFDILGDAEQDQAATAVETTFTFTFNLRARTAGNQVIAPLTVAYVDQRDGQRKMVSTNRVEVHVLQAPAEPDIRPAKAPVEVPDAFQPYRRLALFLAGLLGLGLLLHGLLSLVARLRQPREQPVVKPSVVTPRFRALQRLADLEAENLPGQGRVEEYHVRLSQLARDYLGEQFSFNAAESTTTEIALALYQHAVSSGALGLAREVLDGCDRVKFAEERPDLEQMRHLLKATRAMVEYTSPPARAEAT